MSIDSSFYRTIAGSTLGSLAGASFGGPATVAVMAGIGGLTGMASSSVDRITATVDEGIREGSSRIFNIALPTGHAVINAIVALFLYKGLNKNSPMPLHIQAAIYSISSSVIAVCLTCTAVHKIVGNEERIINQRVQDRIQQATDDAGKTAQIKTISIGSLIAAAAMKVGVISVGTITGPVSAALLAGGACGLVYKNQSSSSEENVTQRPASDNRCVIL